MLYRLQDVLEHIGYDVYEPFRDSDQTNVADNPGKVMTQDLVAIEKADAVFAVINGEPPDVGVAVEVGYAAAKNKPIFLFRDDFRRCTDSNKFPVNLMFLAGQSPISWDANLYKSHEELFDKEKGLYTFMEMFNERFSVPGTHPNHYRAAYRRQDGDKEVQTEAVERI